MCILPATRKHVHVYTHQGSRLVRMHVLFHPVQHLCVYQIISASCFAHPTRQGSFATKKSQLYKRFHFSAASLRVSEYLRSPLRGFHRVACRERHSKDAQGSIASCRFFYFSCVSELPDRAVRVRVSNVAGTPCNVVS